ncbi:hypothetical protein ERX35_010080 [Macrococcus equipercicus]|uniref:Uncharacterized protein n=1 Tax=Macrococcus equipercicus TaxID=69967 RepID=A0ABQ6R6T8_9STAP|nr:hypothetical protein [Macrococcus equipercicus]KAA1036992.1 hypothetical protein ERX35_010080 [Macrococcus equipercicus]
MKNSIKKELDIIFENWYAEEEVSETYFSDNLFRLSKDKSQSELFMYVDDCLEKMLDTQDFYDVSELVNYAHSFYVWADTTEVTPLLKKNFKEVKSHILRYGDNRSIEFVDFMEKKLKL